MYHKFTHRCLPVKSFKPDIDANCKSCKACSTALLCVRLPDLKFLLLRHGLNFQNFLNINPGHILHNFPLMLDLKYPFYIASVYRVLSRLLWWLSDVQPGPFLTLFFSHSVYCSDYFCCFHCCTSWSLSSPGPVMSQAKLSEVCICRVSVAVVCCINSLNTDGAACLCTWQVHCPGSSPPSIPPSLPHFFCQRLSLSVFLSVLCTCCPCLYWSALPCLCVCLSVCLFLCVCVRFRCCSPVLQIVTPHLMDHSS